MKNLHVIISFLITSSCVSVKVKNRLESELANKEVEIERLKSTEQNLAYQTEEIRELKAKCDREKDSLANILFYTYKKLDSLKTVNYNSFQNYYWSSIENVEQKFLKKTKTFDDGRQEIYFWKIKRPSYDRISYEVYDNTKRLIAITEEVITDSSVFFLSNKWIYNDNWIFDSFEKNEAFIFCKGSFSSKFHALIPNGEFYRDYIRERNDVLTNDKIKLNNEYVDCVKWISEDKIWITQENYFDYSIGTSYLQRNKGVIYSEVVYPNDSSKNFIVLCEIMDLKDF